jgi:hypothetical protein
MGRIGQLHLQGNAIKACRDRADLCHVSLPNETGPARGPARSEVGVCRSGRLYASRILGVNGRPTATAAA